MGFWRLGLAVLLLSGWVLGAAHAQSISASGETPGIKAGQDYASGFRITAHTWHQEHAVYMPGDPEDAQGAGPVTLGISYPLIVNPLTPETTAYNAAISRLIPRWWKDIGGPRDNSQAADPDTNYMLYCVPGGGPGDNGPPGTPSQESMLSGIVSMTCMGIQFYHGGVHPRTGESEEWGFNWFVSQHRPIQPDDIFIANSGWSVALTTMINTHFKGLHWEPKSDASDRHRWVVGTDGLGFAYTANELSGSDVGIGSFGGFFLIPWSKLAPYLRKDGIVPQADWSAE